MITKLAALLLGAVAIAGVPAGHAATVNFSFSFTNTAEGGGLVRGVILGLKDNTVSAAKSVRVTTNDNLGGESFGLGEYVGRRGINLFYVSNGELSKFAFYSTGIRNRPPQVVCCSLWLNSMNSDHIEAGLSNRNNGVNIAAADDFSIRRIGPTPVPTPAPIMMLMSALAGLGWVRLRRRGSRAI